MNLSPHPFAASPVLTTRRLILRPFTPEDLPALFAIFSDRETNTFLPWFPLSSMEEAGQFFEERYKNAVDPQGGLHCAVCLKSDNVPIGYVNRSGDDSHDLGYGLRKEFWHRGLALEAAGAVVEQARRDGLSYLTATHDANNPRSGAVMRKLGMSYRYSYQEQWQPKNIPVIFHMYQLNLGGQNAAVPEYRKYWDSSSVHFIAPPQ